MKLLFVGFDVESLESRSKEWVTACSNLAVEGHAFATLFLPYCWQTAFGPLETALRQDWAAIVCFADKDCDGFAMERIALNEMDPREKDAEGRRPLEKIIEPAGDPGYWTRLPFRELSIRLTEANLHATPSHSAGTGLANFVFYRLLQTLDKKRTNVSSGLIQVGAGLPEPSEEVAKRFVSILLATLDSNAVSEDRLGFDSESLRSLRERK